MVPSLPWWEEELMLINVTRGDHAHTPAEAGAHNVLETTITADHHTTTQTPNWPPFPRGRLMYYTIGERFCAQPILRRRPDAILHQCEWKRERQRDYAHTPAEAGARNVLTPTRYTGPLCDPIHREPRLRTTTGTLTRPPPIRAAHHHVLGSHHAEL